MLIGQDTGPSVSPLAAGAYIQVQKECVAMVTFITDDRKVIHKSFDVSFCVVQTD